MASDRWLRTILIVRKETRCRHIGHSYRLTARDLLYASSHRQERERERNVLFNDTLKTFYLWLYGIRHMVKDHSDSEKGNPLPPHMLLLSINSKGSFICIIPQTGEREREMFYLTTHSTHFIYGYMASDRWLRTILIVRKETRCHHIGYSYRLTARVLLYASSHRQERERNVLFNDALNTFYVRIYGVRQMVKDHSDSEGKPAAATWTTLSD